MPEWPPLREYSGSRAVLMGTSEYSFLPGLPAALNSLERMAGLLTGPLCGWPVGRVDLLVNERGPGDLPDRLITSFEDAADVALFYYVGHGQIDLANHLCLGLAGSRTEANRRAATSLPFEAVRLAMLDSPAMMKIVILDCCFAGLASLPANSLAASPDDVLDRTAGSGAYTMAASAAYSPAWYDTTPGVVRPQTFFTQYLVDLVEDGIPGQPSGLRLHPLFARLRDRLASDKRPVPVERSVDAARDFVFAHNAAPLEAQRDLVREVTELTRRLAQAEAHRAVAEAARDQARLMGEARERVLRAEIAERTRELELLQEQARSRPAMPAREREELDEAIDVAQRLLDETTAAHEVATTAAAPPEQTAPHVAETEAPGDAGGGSSRKTAPPRSTPIREGAAPGALGNQPSTTPQPTAGKFVDSKLATVPGKRDLGSLPPPPASIAVADAVIRRGTGNGQLQVSLRNLSSAVQLRSWRLRAAIMVTVGVLAWLLTRSWVIALTVAMLAAITDVIYRWWAAARYGQGPTSSGARQATRWQLRKMRREGYLALGARPVPNSREFIDHLVVGPTGVYAIDSEKWNPTLPIRTWNGKKLYHGPESQKDRLEHAAWKASEASEVLSGALGTEIVVRPALAIYGPRIPWDIATIRNVDVFTGSALRKYLKQRSRMKDGVVRLTREEVRTIYDTAARMLPEIRPS